MTSEVQTKIKKPIKQINPITPYALHTTLFFLFHTTLFIIFQSKLNIQLQYPQKRHSPKCSIEILNVHRGGKNLHYRCSNSYHPMISSQGT